MTELTDIRICVYALNETTGAHAVGAILDDGSHLPKGELRLDKTGLLEAEADPEECGFNLWDALLSGPIRRAYDRITGRTEAETNGPVRVRLRIDGDAAEPWTMSASKARGARSELRAGSHRDRRPKEQDLTNDSRLGFFQFS